MAEVTDELLVDGVKQFIDAMNRLLAGIEKARRQVTEAALRPTTTCVSSR